MTKPENKFDTKKLTKFAIDEITKFAKEHQEETFYGFSIDGQLLCLNSEEQFEKKLAFYQEELENFNTKEQIAGLKKNPGDWQYQGFAEFEDKNGFDNKMYLKHSEGEKEYQLTSDYAQSMDKVVANLIESNVFDLLKKSHNFYANRVELNYN